MDELDVYKKALERERKARATAEQLLESKVRDIYLVNEALNAANQQVKAQQKEMIKTEKLVSLGTLAAGVAHEINNPLAFIKSNINTLQRYLATLLEQNVNDKTRFIKDDAEEIFVEVQDGIKRVQDIVADLKSFARSKPADLNQANANEAVNAAIRITRGQIKYDCEVDTELLDLPPIYCNVNELSQVFINMLMNAADASGDGGKIQVKSYSQGDNIIFTVTDNGHGIPEKILDNIFTPFFTSKAVGKGTGLGLSVSHGIIQDLGGDITVVSTEGQGSCFTITIPVKENQTNDTKAEDEPQ